MGGDTSTPVPSISSGNGSNALQQNRILLNRNASTSSSPSSSASAATSSSSSSSPSPKATSPALRNATIPTIEHASSNPHAFQSTDLSSSEALKYGPQLPMEDAKSIAISIENQEMMSRSDLEMSLLRNLFAPVKSLESKVSNRKHRIGWHWVVDMRREELFVPQTRVFYVSKQYRTVFMVDVSSSVLTVDSGGSKIVMGQVMETLTKCLAGLSERFSCPGMEEDFVQSEIHITVVAECSQFASNLHTGEMLANFPTMKVLLQDVVLTETNLHNVLKVLRVQLAKFQARLSKFRGELRRTRDKLGYSLAVEDSMADVNTELDVEDDISQRKSWGVGLSGANLSYTLTAGLFALGMMSTSASPSLVVITDGVVKSNLLHGSTILRRLMELDVSCSIVQLGNHNEAVPGCNWGFIQDTEALRFVAEATLGKFMYSQDCISTDKGRGPNTNRVAPNMYHRAFLIRELCLLKPRPGLDDIDDREDTAGYTLANFPWDPKSQPEPVKMMQTSCKEYHINIPVVKLVAARIRQGFRIKGVFIAPDRERPSLERYMITMTLAWLPNITIQYKLKGHVSKENCSSNFFSRFDSPKIDIDIIAYQAFALYFLNSQSVSVNANHSVYAKVLRIHRYIIGLSDSDVTLRGLSNSHVSANQAVHTQRAKLKERSRKLSYGATSPEREREDLLTYLSRISEQWSGLAKDADSQYSRGWYNEYEFDALVVVPPPAFLPSTLDTKNTLVKYSEGLEATVKGIRSDIRNTWASFTIGDTYIQTYQSPEKTPHSAASSQFCELRLFNEPNVAILRVQLRFFGVELSQRRLITKNLKEKIYNLQAVQSELGGNSKTESEILQAKALRCQRPVHRLLMRHLMYEAPLSQIPEAHLTDFHTHVSEPIGEESVMRSYLVHKHWGWKDQVRDSAYLAENGYMASQDLAFQYLCAQRIGEGFMLASALPDRVVFYKEVELLEQEGSLLRGSTSIQYLVFRGPVTGELVTELWMEPSLDAHRNNLFDRTKAQIIAVDRFVLSRLATYEAIHTIGRLRLRPEVSSLPERGFMYPWLFDPATLLRQQRLITLAYEAPRWIPLFKEDHIIDMQQPPRKCIHTLGLGTTLVAEGAPNSLAVASSGNKELLLTRNASTTSLNQSLLEAEAAMPSETDLVAEYKDQLRELCCVDRDLAILHLFMERSLSQLADGEIMPGNEDDACSQFFLDLKTSIQRSPEVRETLMTFHCAYSFQDIRCFVKSFNAKFFRLIIVPRLGSVITHLTKLRSLPTRDKDMCMEQARQDFMSCFMFECLRSKPLSDVSEYNTNALEQSMALFELHPMSLGPVVHQQPMLLQPIVNEDQGKARVQESTLQLIDSISQAYSHSFAKAIYASLIEGHVVQSSDLKKACQICTRTTIDINISGFLNTLEQGRRSGTLRDESFELKTRFMNVLKHSFELAPVSGSDHTYFYRPLLRRLGAKLTKPRSRKRSPSVSRSGSIDADMEDALAEVIESAERPLFLHLECSFQKPLTPASELERTNLKPSVTFPVNELPVSYIYKDAGSREYDYAPSNIGLDSRPVDSSDGTIAILHLVVSTLPMPEDYAGPTLKTVDSETKINIDSSQLAGTRSLQHLFPSLESTQVDALVDTEARLEWLVKEEVMHGLLNMTPVTVDILGLIETQLKTKSNFVSFPTAMILPLTFVKRRRGHEIFMQELGRAKMHPYELHQVGQYFYLTEGDDAVEEDDLVDTEIAGDDVEDSTGQTKVEPQNEDLPSLSGSLEENSSLSSSNDLCHGLGIVILPNPKPTKRSTLRQKNGNGQTLPRKKRSFWLILVPKENFVQMYFFSKSLSEEACKGILSHARKAISELCVKVNQLTLLQSLNETRYCSTYLVPGDDTDPNADSESSSESDQLSQEDDVLVTGGSKPADESQTQRKFKPGEFACPLVYRVAWPLHWRVKPGQAAISVALLGLHPFAVHNRKNFFVVESQDDHDQTKKTVVFLRLSEVEVQPEQESSTPAADDAKGPHLSVGKGEDFGGHAPVTTQNLEDSVSRVNSPRPSPTASPGSKVATPPVIRTETRELVIEVYGVEPPGKKVTEELFVMLESRFYNSVVLSVVSTFLSRNTTLKLTQADVDFILPVERLKPMRQVLEIPQFINVPFAFLMYLKQNLCLYLSPLAGPDKVSALTKYYRNRYGRLSTSDRSHDRTSHSHQLQIGDFSFFYNAVQGRPPTAVESHVGIGVAGVCLTVLGQDGKPVFEVGYQEGDHDKEDIEKYFASSQNSSDLKPSKYSLAIEVWAQGLVNAQKLLETICLSFRQSLCDDIIETSIAQGLCPSARDRKNDIDELDGEPLIGERIQKNFIDPSFKVLQHSYQWKNPAVQSLALQYSMPPWIMDSFLLELDEILTDVSVQFSPLLIRSMADCDRYKEYKASSGARKSFGDMTSIRFILIGGIQDLGDGSSSSYYGRRTSMGSDRSHSRRSSLAEGQSLHHSHKTSTHSSQQHPKRQLEDIKMYANAITASGQDETMLTRNCFVVITAHGFGLQAYTYNWGKTYHEFMFSAIEKVVKWHRDRMRLLDNILLQKMGLFHHVPSMLSPSQTPSVPIATHPTPAVTSSMIYNHPRVPPQNSPHLSLNLRTIHPETNSSTPTVSKTTTSPKSLLTSTVVSDAAGLASLVEDQFPNRTRSLNVGTSLYGNEDSRPDPPKASSSSLSLVARPNPATGSTSHVHVQSLSHSQAQSSEQNSATASAIINAGLDVDQILRDYCLEPLETPRDEHQVQDEVQRHGKPFLDTFTYHTKNAEGQQNAYNVYQKWSRRYKDRKGSPNALHENMTTSDLAIMLRSSRLLHFCRTPLLFTEFSSSLFRLTKCPSGAGGTQSSSFGILGQGTNAKADPSRPGSDFAPAADPVARWYSALADTFMKEYSQYLATVGMQLLMYGNSKFDKPFEVSQSEELSFMSQFTVSQSLSVPSPAAFLFKSLQGGSIMCEVRLQGMFVCVTLYTLNRRYGRVKVAAPGFATAEANKQSLRLFTEQCARFKDRIHVNSFVYDFHLRYIHRILMESSKMGVPTPPNAGLGFTSAPSSSLPYSFDLLDVLHQFLQYHSRPAAYSRNRVYRGVYRTNVAPGETELPGHLFEYVIKNPQRYGFQVIHHQNRPRSCFVSGRDLLAGFGGSHRAADDRSEHQRFVSEGVGQGLKGFGVGANRGGLPPNPERRPFGPHARHTSHESCLNTKRASRRMTTSRSSYNVKETAILEEGGVEYMLVLSDGEQDSMGLTVHYYLIILREEEVVKKLEERHGPLLGARDRLLGASRDVSVVRESGSSGLVNPGIGSGLANRSSAIANQLQTVEGAADEDGAQSGSKQGCVLSNPDVNNAEVQPQECNIGGERFMDSTELQERITESAVLGDVVRAAEVRLDMMLKQAAQFFDRDSLWEMLLQGKIGNSGVILTGSNSSLIAASHPVNTPGGMPSAETGDYLLHNSGRHHGARHDSMSASSAELGFSDFLALGQRFHSTPLKEMEPDFQEIVMAPGIDWDEVLTFLARYYARWAREFMEHDETQSPGPAVSSLGPGPSASGFSLLGRRGSTARSLKSQKARRHLVIFNPHNRDLLVHFVINMNTPGSGNGIGEGVQESLSLKAPSLRGGQMRASAGDLYTKLDRQVSGGSSSSRSRLHSQSHSQLQALLLSSSQPSSPLPQTQPPVMSPQQHYPQVTQPSFSETSSRVSSMTSIARAASLAVSKVASRLQSSRSRESSIAPIAQFQPQANQSKASSRAPSVVVEDDVQSMTTTTTQATGGMGSQRTSLSKATGGNFGSLLNPDGPSTQRTRQLSSASLSSQSRRRRSGGADGDKKLRRQRPWTTGSERFGAGGDGDSVVDSLDDGGRSVSAREDENDSGEDEYDDGMEYDENRDEDNDEGDEEDDEDEDEDGYDDGDANVRVFSVSREPKSGYNAIESEHVGDIIRTLSYWIWRSHK
ncbi:KICSTOR complex protein szt2 [Dissophora ornata]|nr:KICSTOR complex protein szt2 [Dissophora ornata]